MPHFKVSDDSHSHPKAIMAGDAAWGMWNRAGCWSMAYGTDGFIPEWWVKQQPQGAAKARALIGAQLWQRSVYLGDRPEYQGQKGYVFHEWRQDAYAKVEADRKKARDRMKAGRISPNVRPEHSREHSPNTARSSPEHPGIYPLPITQNDSGYVESAGPDSTEREPRSAPIRPDANRLVAQVIPKTHPNAVRTELRLQTSALLNEGQPPEILEAALQLWLVKSVHPKALPSLVSEVLNQREKPSTSSPNGKPHKMRALAELAAETAATETRNRKELTS